MQSETDFYAQVAEFTEVRPRYEALATVLHAVLASAAKEVAPMAIVQSRAKEVASFAGKIIRKSEEDPVRDFTDLCGVRVITHLPSEVERLSRFIEANFEIDTKNSVDISQHREPAKFGYRSVHYIVQLLPDTFLEQVQLAGEQQHALYRAADCPMKAEIQVRTLLEHAWADFNHDRIYKSGFEIPDPIQHEVAGLMAMLETVDNTFERIKDALRIFEASYSQRLTKAQVRDAIAREESVFQFDPQNRSLALDIAMLAMELEDWDRVIATLEPLAGTQNTPILRTLGIALCKKHGKHPESDAFQRGRHYLESARLAKDVDAISSLAGTYKKTDPEQAHALYREAYAIDPSDPYPLMNYLQYEIIKARSIDMVPLLKPVIDMAIQRCKQQVAVGVNLPWAHYTVGFFRLILNEGDAAMEAYRKAIAASNAPWMVETSLTTLNMFQSAELSAVTRELDCYQQVLALFADAEPGGS